MLKKRKLALSGVAILNSILLVACSDGDKKPGDEAIVSTETPKGALRGAKEARNRPEAMLSIGNQKIEFDTVTCLMDETPMTFIAKSSDGQQTMVLRVDKNDAIALTVAEFTASLMERDAGQLFEALDDVSLTVNGETYAIAGHVSKGKPGRSVNGHLIVKEAPGERQIEEFEASLSCNLEI